MVADPLTLMAVHAHPDDESSSTGGVLALAAREGIRTVLVTCTNGELGDGPGHVKPGEPGHHEADVAAVRLDELRKACDVLDVSSLELLGYHDSGMADWPYHKQPDVFSNVPVDVVATRLGALMDEYRPAVVVTYDGGDGYNHPDHRQTHQVTVAAIERTGVPAKLYYIAHRRRSFQRLREVMLEQGYEPPEPPSIDPERLAELERQMAAVEQRITTTVDIGSVVQAKRTALAAHASQLDESWWSRIPEGVFGEVFGTERFIRARDTTGAPIPENDLFAGWR
jgi:LmbE family N-acetylglucosaminyl deacetylase